MEDLWPFEKDFSSQNSTVFKNMDFSPQILDLWGGRCLRKLKKRSYFVLKYEDLTTNR